MHRRPRPRDARPATPRGAPTTQTRWSGLGLAVALVLGLGLTACESRGSIGDSPAARCVPEGTCDEGMFELGLVASRGDATRGATLYQSTCAVCHGPAGRGVQDARRIDMTSPAWHARMRDGEIARITRAGRPPIMPAFPLSDQQVRDLLAFIRTLKVDAAPAATPGY